MAVKISYCDVDYDKVGAYAAANRSWWKSQGWGDTGVQRIGNAWCISAGPGVGGALPPPVIRKEMAVQYESDEDKPMAEMLAGVLDADLINTLTEDYTPYKKIVLVGGQEANSLFRHLVKFKAFVNVTEADAGYIYIQRAIWDGREVWGVAGWETPDTINTAKYLRDAVSKLGVEVGLPTKTLRVKPLVETPQQKQWREYFDNPDIVKTIGILPLTTQEAFTRVFAGYSVIEARDMAPELGHYLAVALIIAGLSIAAATTVYAALVAIPNVGTSGMMKGMAGVAREAGPKVLEEKGTSGLYQMILGVVKSPYWIAFTGINLFWINIWNLTDPNWWWPVWVKMSGDVKARFNGLRIDVETKLKQSYNLTHISPTAATRAEALTLLRATKPLIEELFNMLSGYEIGEEIRTKYPEFEPQVAAFVSQYNELVTLAGGTAADKLVLEKLTIVQPAVPPSFPEEITVSNVKVLDGDTIEYPGHPEVMNKIRFAGMDAHEAGTTAGMNEIAYLKTLIEGKTITLKIDPVNTIEMYGRLLGVPFIEGINVVHMMLAKFGKEILGTKYKNKYVDWDENTRIAKGEVAPVVPVPEIETAAYWYDYGYTDVEAEQIAEWVKSTKKWPTIKEIYENLGFRFGGFPVSVIIAPTPPPEADREPPVVAPPVVFKIYIDSEPSNAKLYIDDVYTHHLTPSNEAELKDVMHLLAPGEHVLKATKGGKEGAVRATITDGDNGTIKITLGVVGLVPVEPAPQIETAAYWYDYGYTDVEAEQIAEWVKSTKKWPTIKEIYENLGFRFGGFPVSVIIAPTPPPEADREPPVVAPPVEVFKFNVLSTPSRAKLYIDGIYTKHLTPSDEKELKDVMHLLTPGTHTIKVTKAGKEASKKVEVLAGYNEPIYLTLEVVGLPKTKEDIEKEIATAMALLEKLRAELAAM